MGHVDPHDHHHDAPVLHVVVLGAGGGPQESNITAMLVRSVSQHWAKGSIVAVDAGIHLSAIARLIGHDASSSSSSSPSCSWPGQGQDGPQAHHQDSHQDNYKDPLPPRLAHGPLQGLPLPCRSVEANAAHVVRTLVDTYLITHPHLDHISGLVVNTAGLSASRPKKIAGLPSTIQALKNHIFNNVIWPNLSDENNGAGLLTYLRLVEGGSPALGHGSSRGYVEVCDGLLVKAWSVSHGHCIERHVHRGSASAASASFSCPSPRYGSHDASAATQPQPLHGRASMLGSAAATCASGTGGASPQIYAAGSMMEQERYCVYDSSAYFIQDHQHRREVLIFGDVEPDSISLYPRNLAVWQEAAPKIAAGLLTAIFIECSYDDSQSNDRLFGHLKPVFVIQELHVLAAEVEAARVASAAATADSGSASDAAPTRKRKRTSLGSGTGAENRRPSMPIRRQSAAATVHFQDPFAPKPLGQPSCPSPNKRPSCALATPPRPPLHSASPVAPPSANGTPRVATPTKEDEVAHVEPAGVETPAMRPLQGLKVVIIHVKEKLTDEEPAIGERIKEQLNEHEKTAQLGCEFIVSYPGQSFYL
ncbi:hypothetical protein CDD82_3379 [Ophiocordyceps australis]|uniref:3',5'-cyclic-nucleotide phosphodiesterase n=1 Tax=Ophiocordyceps australis TaxID=1399860 RepID=A0A2C5XPV3_9HYPO|nr:hypothetical protein CDD82_3379 [Ophiocordyceps australis]